MPYIRLWVLEPFLIRGITTKHDKAFIVRLTAETLYEAHRHSLDIFQVTDGS